MKPSAQAGNSCTSYCGEDTGHCCERLGPLCHIAHPQVRKLNITASWLSFLPHCHYRSGYEVLGCLCEGSPWLLQDVCSASPTCPQQRPPKLSPSLGPAESERETTIYPTTVFGLSIPPCFPKALRGQLCAACPPAGHSHNICAGDINSWRVTQPEKVFLNPAG